MFGLGALALKFISLFSSIGTWIAGAIKGAFTAVITHPKETLIAVAVAISGYFVQNWGYTRGTKAADKEISLLKAEVEYYAQQVNTRQEKLKIIEAEAKAAAKENEMKMLALGKDVESIKASYEARIVAARQDGKIKVKTVYVKVPGVDAPMSIETENGEHVCRRYPLGYVSTVNAMVDSANKSIGKAK